MERSNTLLIILALGLVLTSLLLAYDGSDSAKTISVSGSSDVTVSPDKADVFVEVETRGETAEGVKNENSERMANVREALEEAGIAEDQIETQSFDIYPQQRWVSELEKSVVDGYIAEHSLKIEVLDIDDVGEKILNELKKISKSKGWNLIRWITHNDNFRAKALYDRVAEKTKWDLYELK